MNHVIDFSPDGGVEALYNDNFQLSFLGKQSIQRATEIKFREREQDWGIYLERSSMGAKGHFFPVVEADPDREGLNRVCPATVGFSTYEGARQVEGAWLNVCRKKCVSPDSPDGLVILLNVREEFGL